MIARVDFLFNCGFIGLAYGVFFVPFT